MALNTVLLLGRLSQNPEIRYTQNDTPVANFDLAVPGYTKEAPPDYIPIVCWGKQADFVDRYLSKGRQIAIEGRITTRKYTDKEGNNRKSVEVTAARIHFADSRKDAGQGGNQDTGESYPDGFYDAQDCPPF